MSLLLIEGGLTAITVALAFCWPRAGATGFAAVEQRFSWLAREKRISVVTVGLTALLLRLALLPLFPIPKPYIQDDFSFLLAGNTFASGSLTNPTPAMWQHFESFHIDMKPTYMSMYFPAQGLILAAGKVVTGHAWYGILVVTALMCAAICWMLQAWLPPGWALLGGFLAVFRLGLFSYWINTYTGAGSVAALGGALVLGALPRLMKTAHTRYGMWMALGIALLALSRPYEGMLLCLPVAATLAWWCCFSKKSPPFRTLVRRAATPLLLIAMTGAWMGYYNYRVFGNALTLPYTVNRTTYAMAPYYIWQTPHSHPVYRHRQMQLFYQTELKDFNQFRTVGGFLTESILIKPARGILFFAGIALLPFLLMIGPTLFDKRLRFLVLCLPLLIVGELVELWLIPHYLAPFTAVFFAIGLQAMRHLKVWRPAGQPTGAAMVRLSVSLCLAMVVLRVVAASLNYGFSPLSNHDWVTSSPTHGTARAAEEARLEQMPGKQLVIVRYSADHNFYDEWVYNAPDIDRSKVIWARDMGPAENQKLINYYKGRTAWLVEPDTSPVELSRYDGQQLAADNSRLTASAR